MKRTFDMRLALFLFIFLVAGVVVEVTAQTSSKKARKYYENGKALQVGRKWNEAQVEYEKALRLDPDFAEALFALAQLYELNFRPKLAQQLYEKLATAKPDDPQYLIAHSKMADMALLEGNYQQAKKSAAKFLSFQPSDKYKKEKTQAQNVLKVSEFAIEGMKNPLKFNPKELNATFHKYDQQYFPVLTADQEEMIFTARNYDSYEDIYQSSFQNGNWTEPTPIKTLNTEQNEGTTSISADGSIMIFTACEGFRERTVYGSCDLFITYKKGDTWEAPKNLGRKVNSRDWESQPALSADGRRLFFVSDRPGGKGKRDIWMTELDQNNQWTEAVNLGAPINTADEEISPFLHVNGKTLFYSSKGYLGYGGYDIFKSEWKEGAWQIPENIGYPINDYKDQVGLFITSDGKKAYYSDERPTEGKLISRILVSDIPAELNIQTLSGFVKGKVYDKTTGKPLEAAIQLKDLATQGIITEISSDQQTGRYLIVLNQGAAYALHCTVPGYVFNSLSFDYQQLPTDKGVHIDLPMQPLEKGSSVRLNNIFFGFDSFELLETSFTELETVKWFLERHPQVRIEIGGHTDTAGSESYNLSLSEKRAIAVKNYLLEHGIAAKQVEAKGYGSAHPVATNDTEEGRGQNRRIEFKIL